MEKFNLKSLVRSNVWEMSPYSSARDEFTDFDKDMIFLDANENPFSNGVNRYPDPQQRKLKTLIASQKNVEITQLLLGNGSDEVLDLIFRAFCTPGVDHIISFPPTYGMYKVLCATNDIKNTEVLLTQDFQPDVNAILQAIQPETKIIFFCSPNNPSGNLIDNEKIEQVLKQFNGIVVIDEAYIDFAEAESWVSRLGEFPNLIVTQTLSKAYGMAGIRLGLCFASPEIIAVLNKIKPPYNVNELTQSRAFERLSQPDVVKSEIISLIDSRLELSKVLLQIPFVEKIFPSEANFILARVDDAVLRYQELIDKGIVVRNRSNQVHCENTLRFTVGTAEENKRLIRALKELK